MGTPYGLRAAFDSYNRFVRAGRNNDISFLRVKNFVESGPVAQMGFTFTPTTSGALTGYTDYQIDPPPVMRPISMHNMGMAAQAGISLRAGSLDILISHTFVLSQMALRGFVDPRDVFRDPSTLGIVVNHGKQIVSIEFYLPDVAYGEPISWSCLGNANDIR